jgi:hypothetical protein
LNPSKREVENLTFQIQIDVHRNADRERIALLILQKLKQLGNARTICESDALFAELEGLEWLQRQVAKPVLSDRFPPHFKQKVY